MPRRKPRSRSQGDLDEEDKIWWSKHQETNQAGVKPNKSYSNFDKQEEPSNSRRSTNCKTDDAKSTDVTFGRRDIAGEGIYEGSLLNGLRHGKGVLRTKAGHKLFEGNWQSDKRHGYGLSKFDGGNHHEGLYEDGFMHGLGVFLWANGDKYSGNFSKGDIHGYGRFEWANGDIYTGNWTKGCIDGDGCMRKFNGHVLEGRFCKGQLLGWTKKKIPGGDCYEGYMRGNSHVYFGQYKWQTGSRYEGQWKNGIIQGNGFFDNSYRGKAFDPLHPEPYKYKGQFQAGKPHGYGQYHYTDLNADSQGVWDEGGKGWTQMSYESGLVYEGECQDHLKQGQGQLSYLDDEHPFPVEPLDPLRIGEEGWGIEDVLLKYGGKIVGSFKDDLLCGQAVLILSNNATHTLQFTEGKVVK